jgi:outer membrane protein assembly factor BamE
MKKILFILLGVGFVNGCSHFPFLYRPDIQQGNIISAEIAQQLKPGMPTEQVRYLMGNPVLTNVLDQNEWDYIYTFEPAKGSIQRRQVTVHFTNGIVSSVTN